MKVITDHEIEIKHADSFQFIILRSYILLMTVLVICSLVACGGSKMASQNNPTRSADSKKDRVYTDIDKLIGTWKLLIYNGQSQNEKHFTIAIDKKKIRIYQQEELIDSCTWIMTSMYHDGNYSLSLSNNPPDKYEWLQSGMFGVMDSFLETTNWESEKTKFESISSNTPNYKNSKIEQLPDYFLNQTWYHSYEEDKDKQQYFRPATSQYIPSPSRWRNQFVFRNNNTCQYRFLAPNDAHEMKNASWAYYPNKIFLLENKIDIIDVYEILSITDTLMILSEEIAPINKVYGKWKLIESNEQNLSKKNYSIYIKGNAIEVFQSKELKHESSMSFSPRRIQEPMSFTFNKDITRVYPWLKSGHYGIINDTLVLEISDDIQSKFIR